MFVVHKLVFTALSAAAGHEPANCPENLMTSRIE